MPGTEGMHDLVEHGAAAEVVGEADQLLPTHAADFRVVDARVVDEADVVLLGEAGYELDHGVVLDVCDGLVHGLLVRQIG